MQFDLGLCMEMLKKVRGNITEQLPSSKNMSMNRLAKVVIIHSDAKQMQRAPPVHDSWWLRKALHLALAKGWSIGSFLFIN